MDRYFGFDLGDAESAIARIDTSKDGQTPEILTVEGAKSFVSAYALKNNGELLVGESACYAPDVRVRKIRFKSAYLTDRTAAAKDVKSFAAGVLGDLYRDGSLIRGEDAVFYVGTPAGWDANTKETYREIFEEVGYPPLKVISESRAALVAACQSRHLQVGYDILSKPVLVVDIGSSTTDFAYIRGGKEVDMRTLPVPAGGIETAGEVRLGGGIMDEILLEECLKASRDGKLIRKIFADSPPWKSLCEFRARRLKEKYFSDEAYFREHPIEESVRIAAGEKTVRLKLFLDPEMADRLTDSPSASLSGRTFHEVFSGALTGVRSAIASQNDPSALPELLFLTGGVSKLPAIRNWCEKAFPEAVVITGAEPEFSVAKGLALSGQIDEEMRRFRMEIREFIDSDHVEKIVEQHLAELYRTTADVIVDPMMEQVVYPVFLKWRDGQIRRLSEIDRVLQDEITRWLGSEDARKILRGPTQAWLKIVANQLEEYTVPICVRHRVPYKALSLNTYLSADDIDIHIDAGGVMALHEITFLVDAVISIMVGMLCGGSGIALISSGLPGLAAGAMVSLLILLLGRNRVEEKIQDADIPVPVRKLIAKSFFRQRLKAMGKSVKGSLTDTMESEKSGEIRERLVREISDQIEDLLMRMAKVVEIPLGT